MATQIDRIDFLDHSVTPPELIGSFFWSEQLGVSFTNSAIMAELERGIYVPDVGALVYPRDGRKFFDALKFAGGGLVVVTAPRAVSANEAQG